LFAKQEEGSELVSRPVVLLSALVSLSGFHSGALSAAESAARRFEIVASRFKFEPGVIEVPEGAAVELVLRSADTDHGLAITAFKVKVAIPKGGAPVSAAFVASRAGRFPMECSEYCGAGHKQMKGELVVREATR
jgi:cytochrome c oxidase subunit II